MGKRGLSLVGCMVVLAGSIWAGSATSALGTSAGRGPESVAVTVPRPPGALPKPTFGEPTIAGIQGNGFEEDIRLDPTNPDRVYTSAPASLSSTIGYIWTSRDGGKTFKWVPAAEPLTGKLPTCIGGGDTELAVDSAGHLYMNDLTLANFSTSRSDDHGKHFVSSCTGVFDTGVDREWYAIDGNPTVPGGGDIYLVNDDLIVDPVCSGSEANNVLVIQRSPIPGAEALAGVQFNPPFKITGPTGPGGSCTEGIMGNVEVSPVSGNVFVIHDNAALDEIRIARCHKVSFLVDPSGMTCTDKVVSSFPGQITGGDFPTMAIDSAGNLFAVWEQLSSLTDNTVLKFSASLYPSEGNVWSPPITLPANSGQGTLLNNVFAWIAAGDRGNVDVAWYGTTADNTGTAGPDSTNGDWGLYFTQSLNANTNHPAFSAPVLASGHFVHRGTIQTLIGGQTGNRTLGDFLQIRVGAQGEAHISFADSNNVQSAFLPHAMYVRQNGGPSVFDSTPLVEGEPIPEGTVADPQGDATYEASGTISPSIPNMDILSSSLTQPDAATYRLTMQVQDLSSLAPPIGAGDTDSTVVWMTQWLVPSSTDPNGGKNFFAYMESTLGQAPTFWDGENAYLPVGGGVTFTYPGVHELTGHGTTGYDAATGVITIDVPVSDVAVPGAIGDVLHSVTTSSLTAPLSMETPPPDPETGAGGQLFNLIDPAPAYEMSPPADLSVQIADSPDPVAVNDSLTHSLTVTNAGPGGPDDVVVLDRLPKNVTFVSAVATLGGVCGFSGGRVVTCAFQAFPLGASATIAIRVIPTRVGSIVDVAKVGSSRSDPNSANNEDRETTTVQP